MSCLINIQKRRIIDGTPAPSSLPVKTTNHCTGSTLTPYLKKLLCLNPIFFDKHSYTYFSKFSKHNLIPPIVNNKNAQFINPVKFWNPELHENKLSLGRWHGLSGWDFLTFCCIVQISSARVTLRVLRRMFSFGTSSESDILLLFKSKKDA